jgi:hypothetical protein
MVGFFAIGDDYPLPIGLRTGPAHARFTDDARRRPFLDTGQESIKLEGVVNGG